MQTNPEIRHWYNRHTAQWWRRTSASVSLPSDNVSATCELSSETEVSSAGVADVACTACQTALAASASAAEASRSFSIEFLSMLPKMITYRTNYEHVAQSSTWEKRETRTRKNTSNLWMGGSQVRHPKMVMFQKYLCLRETVWDLLQLAISQMLKQANQFQIEMMNFLQPGSHLAGCLYKKTNKNYITTWYSIYKTT